MLAEVLKLITRKGHKVTLTVPPFDPSYANAPYHPPAVLTSMVDEILYVPPELEFTSGTMTMIYILYMFYVFLLLVLFIVAPDTTNTQLFLFRFYIVFIRMGGDPTEEAYVVTKAARSVKL
jgi:hypothetical protein